MFVWGARTLADALREHLPNTAFILEQIAASYGTAAFDETFAALYPKCENISIDYALLEPRSKKGEGKSGIYCIPASFGWNDLGSWTALYEHHTANQVWRSRTSSRRAKSLSWTPRATLSTPASSSPSSACTTWLSWKPTTRC